MKFAIIGCGRIAQRHAEHISEFGKLEAVCDIKFESAVELGEKYNAKAYKNGDDLLSNETEVYKSGVVDVNFGSNVKYIEPVNLYGCNIGNDVFIGPFVEIQKKRIHWRWK